MPDLGLGTLGMCPGASTWKGRRAARRGQGGRLTTLNFWPGAVTTLNFGHVSIFYQVIFPVGLHKQRSIESQPRKQRLENDAKEREKQTIVAKNQLVGLIMQAVIGAHCKNSTGCRAYVASFIGQSRRERTYVPRYLCSPVPMFPEPMFPGTYVPQYLCSPICG